MAGNLSGTSALVIGAGGLGGPAALALAAGGVGRLVVLDEDEIEISNLNRQPLFGDADLGRRKAAAAAERISSLHPSVKVEGRDLRFGPDGAEDLVRGCDVVVDASDNFATRFLANDVALAARRPLVHGAVLRYTAQLLTVMPGKTGCLRCLFEAPPAEGTVPTCAQAGVLGALAGFAGALMGAEALRLLSGERGAYAGRLVAFDARSGRSRLVPLRIRAGCPACSSAAASTQGPA
jgi:molybdopterin/thiamine biosynthesis adenylyltransferase